MRAPRLGILMSIGQTLALFLQSSPIAQQYAITNCRVQGTTLTIETGGSSNVYNILYAGDSIATITQVVDISLDSLAHNVMADARFYRTVGGHTNSPCDTDDDGIDDLTELAATYLAPLDPDDRLPAQYESNLNAYAEACVRYFTSPGANNKEVGFTHAFFGTGPFQVNDGGWREEAWPMTRGYGSHVNINEVTLRFLALAVAYQMGWLSYLADEATRYVESWGQIRRGLKTLRYMQLSSDDSQFYQGHFHRTYLTATNRLPLFDQDRYRNEIVRPPTEDIQSSDDSGLPYLNLLILQGLADAQLAGTVDHVTITTLCTQVRQAIDLSTFVVSDEIVHNFTGGVPQGTWDRESTEGPLILAAMLMSDQVSTDQFYTISASLTNYPTTWTNLSELGTTAIETPSHHSAMFMHGLRAMHGLPVTDAEHGGLSYFEMSTRPVFNSHLDYARHCAFKTLGSQVMTQTLYGQRVLESSPGVQAQFPGNEDAFVPATNRPPCPATAPHAWMIPLSRWRYLDADAIDTVFTWMASYEADFFHNGSGDGLGWEATIPWDPTDTNYAWYASDGEWKYCDYGRPFEALNAAYIVLSIFDALNQKAPLASCKFCTS